MKYCIRRAPRITLLTVALATAALVATANRALAMRYPGPGPDPAQGGGMALYEYGSQTPAAAAPQPPRIGQSSLNNQYMDGMNLYQYVRSNPIVGVDPDGQVVVLLAGWRQGRDTMGLFKTAIESEMKKTLKQYEGGAKVNVKIVIEANGKLRDDYDARLRNHYKEFVKRKKADKCSLEQFVAVGHSSGASSIYNELWAGTFNEKNTKEAFVTPAFFGLYEMILYKKPAVGPPDLTGKLPTDLKVGIWHVKLITTQAIRGIPNHNAPFGVHHLNITKNPKLAKGLGWNAATWYMMHVQWETSFEGAIKRKWTTDGTKKAW